MGVGGEMRTIMLAFELQNNSLELLNYTSQPDNELSRVKVPIPLMLVAAISSFL